MASNIEEIGLAGLSAVDDQVLSEIVFTLKKFILFIIHLNSLKKIDISNCPNVTHHGVHHLLSSKQNLVEFQAAHNHNALTGYH